MSEESFLKIFVKITSLIMTPLLNFQNLEFSVLIIFYILIVCYD